MKLKVVRAYRDLVLNQDMDYGKVFECNDEERVKTLMEHSVVIKYTEPTEPVKEATVKEPVFETVTGENAVKPKTKPKTTKAKATK